MNSDALTPFEFLETVAGERCPCGHTKDEHEPPRDNLPGNFTAVMGACTSCECRGLIE